MSHCHSSLDTPLGGFLVGGGVLSNTIPANTVLAVHNRNTSNTAPALYSAGAYKKEGGGLPLPQSAPDLQAATASSAAVNQPENGHQVEPNFDKVPTGGALCSGALSRKQKAAEHADLSEAQKLGHFFC